MINFNGLKVGDRVRSEGFLSKFPGGGVVQKIYEMNGHVYADYLDGNGLLWRAHADQLTKEPME